MIRNQSGAVAARRMFSAARSAVAGAPPDDLGSDWLSRTKDSRAPGLILTAIGIAVGAAVLVFVTDMSGTTAKLNDFYREAWPAYAALTHGHLVGFLRLAPAYAGSLVLRAPFALIPTAWGGGSRQIYFASAIPCMLALAAFCTWLAAQPRRRTGITKASRIGAIIFCVLNPLVIAALLCGHPEDVLGGVLCVAAVVLASKGRTGWAGLVIGLAVVNKSWALVAVPVVLVAMPGDRQRVLLIATAAAGAVLIPVMAVRIHGFGATANGAAIGSIFHPSQLLWWLGRHSWIARGARAVIVLLAIACAALWWIRRPGASRANAFSADALLLLALVLLLRAALDPWNNLYYHVPFLLALVAYEVRSGRMPLLTVIYTVALLIVVPASGVPRTSPDLSAALYAVIVVPMIGWLIATLYLPSGAWGGFMVAPSSQK